MHAHTQTHSEREKGVGKIFTFSASRLGTSSMSLKAQETRLRGGLISQSGTGNDVTQITANLINVIK